MEQNENDSKKSSIKPSRQAAFLVELYVDENDKTVFVIKSPNGQLAKMAYSVDDVATFLTEVTNILTAKDDRQD